MMRIRKLKVIIATVALVVLSTEIVAAQGWFDGTPRWFYDYTNSCIDPEYGRAIYDTRGDTTIENQLMTIVQEQVEYTTFYGELISFDRDRYMYERSDSIFEYVSRRHELVYDFTRQEGDTVVYELSYNPTLCDSALISVLEVLDTIVLGSRELRRQTWVHLNNQSTFGDGFQVIESIGALEGPMNRGDPAQYCFFDACDRTSCKCYDNVALDEAYGWSSCVGRLTSVDDYSSDSIGLYPNPASQKLTIRSGTEITRVRIISTHGQIVSDQRYHTEMDVSYLETGIYFLQTLDSRGNQHVERLVIR